MLASAYAELIYMPRPVSNRRKMEVGHRAKQFAPFAALRGFEETVRKKEILYEPKKELSEEKKNELDSKLRILSKGMKVQAVYFVEKMCIRDRPIIMAAAYTVKTSKTCHNHLHIPRCQNRPIHLIAIHYANTTA